MNRAVGKTESKPAKSLVESIPPEQNVPPDEEDELSVKEEVDLSGAKQANYFRGLVCSCLYYMLERSRCQWIFTY